MGPVEPCSVFSQIFYEFLNVNTGYKMFFSQETLADSGARVYVSWLLFGVIEYSFQSFPPPRPKITNTIVKNQAIQTARVCGGTTTYHHNAKPSTCNWVITYSKYSCQVQHSSLKLRIHCCKTCLFSLRNYHIFTMPAYHYFSKAESACCCFWHNFDIC